MFKFIKDKYWIFRLLFNKSERISTGELVLSFKIKLIIKFCFYLAYLIKIFFV